MSSKKKSSTPPNGFEVLEHVLEALENEVRDKIKESNNAPAGLRKVEASWPIHQVNWQKSRYVYDMFYTFGRISRKVYDYCIRTKRVDAALIAKWKKTGYERLCSTYVINPTNYKFGTTSLCRVPLTERSEAQRQAQDPTTGCFGCASGKGAAPKNIFGNKYGQNLAAVQIAREKRMQAIAQARAKRQREEEEEAEKEEGRRQEADEDEDRRQASKRVRLEEHDSKDEEPPPPPAATTGKSGDEETDDEDEDDDDEDYGPTPAAGIWAGSTRLMEESEVLAQKEDGDNDNQAEKEGAALVAETS